MAQNYLKNKRYIFKNIYDKVKQVNLMVYFEFFDINMFL